MTLRLNFTGQRCIILHRAGETVNILARQLSVLGLEVHAQWRPWNSETAPADVVFVDADAGWSELLPWPPGAPKMPLIALLGSETPSRIKWGLDQGASAIVSKPVAASAIYPALVMAFHAYALTMQQAALVASLTERLRLRPLVQAAIQQLMQEANLEEAAAHLLLRQKAMQSRQPLEQAAAALLAARSGKTAP